MSEGPDLPLREGWTTGTCATAAACAAVAVWRGIVTDEVRPPSVGVTAAVAASAPSEEGAGAPEGYKGATEGEITRGRCLHQSVDEHQMKRRSFAFAVGYIYCFRTHLVYLSFRHGVFILYTPCHLPPQREARALPRRRTDLPPCVFRIFNFAFRISFLPTKMCRRSGTFCSLNYRVMSFFSL